MSADLRGCSALNGLRLSCTGQQQLQPPALTALHLQGCRLLSRLYLDVPGAALETIDATACALLRAVTIRAKRVGVLNLTNCAALGRNGSGGAGGGGALLGVEVAQLGKVLISGSGVAREEVVALRAAAKAAAERSSLLR